MSKRTVRLLVVLDAVVTANNWRHEHIEQAVGTLLECMATSSQHPDYRNISIGRYRVHSYDRAWNRLLGLGEEGTTQT